MFPAPHGAVCAALLAPVMAANLRSLRARPGSEETLQRYAEVARRLTGHPAATADAGIDWVRELVVALRIPPLRTYGVTVADFSLLAEKAVQASSMKGNPVALDPAELREILAQAL